MGKHLEQLSSKPVLDVENLPDGKFRVWEECDHYFYEDFTADELRELAAELVAVSNGERK